MPRRMQKILLLIALSAAIIIIPAYWFSYPLLQDFLLSSQAAGALEVDFLDVGQGDSTLIRTAEGANILIDGGPSNQVLDRLAEHLPFWERTIDLMILSHPHDDHVFGLTSVLENYKVNKIIYTGAAHTAPGYLAWLETIRAQGIPLVIIDHPQEVVIGEETRLEFMYPWENLSLKESANLNNTSVVLKLVYQDASVLFTGDMEEEIEQELISAGADLSADILKVGHHGSNTSTGEEFLKKVNPEDAVIFVGEDNQFGHPNFRILKRLETQGANIFRTDIHGTITAKSQGNGFNIIFSK